MNWKLATASLIFAAGITPAFAETVEINMLNKGEEGTMVFEPSFVRIQPGDTVKFIATDKTHNAETIEGKIPEGAEGFMGKVNEELEATLTEEGIYLVKCKPHYPMGMVMTIAVGDDAEVPEGFLDDIKPKKAVERFEAQFAELDNANEEEMAEEADAEASEAEGVAEQAEEEVEEEAAE